MTANTRFIQQTDSTSDNLEEKSWEVQWQEASQQYGKAEVPFSVYISIVPPRVRACIEMLDISVSKFCTLQSDLQEEFIQRKEGIARIVPTCLTLDQWIDLSSEQKSRIIRNINKFIQCVPKGFSLQEFLAIPFNRINSLPDSLDLDDLIPRYFSSMDFKNANSDIRLEILQDLPTLIVCLSNFLSFQEFIALKSEIRQEIILNSKALSTFIPHLFSFEEFFNMSFDERERLYIDYCKVKTTLPKFFSFIQVQVMPLFKKIDLILNLRGMERFIPAYCTFEQFMSLSPETQRHISELSTQIYPSIFKCFSFKEWANMSKDTRKEITHHSADPKILQSGCCHDNFLTYPLEVRLKIVLNFDKISQIVPGSISLKTFSLLNNHAQDELLENYALVRDLIPTHLSLNQYVNMSSSMKECLSRNDYYFIHFVLKYQYGSEFLMLTEELQQNILENGYTLGKMIPSFLSLEEYIRFSKHSRAIWVDTSNKLINLSSSASSIFNKYFFRKIEGTIRNRILYRMDSFINNDNYKSFYANQFIKLNSLSQIACLDHPDSVRALDKEYQFDLSKIQLLDFHEVETVLRDPMSLEAQNIILQYKRNVDTKKKINQCSIS